MTKEEAIKSLKEKFRSFHNDFIDGKLDVDNVSEEERSKIELLKNLSYLYPYISLSIFIRDILGSDERIDYLIEDKKYLEAYRKETDDFFTLFSGQYFFSERYVRREDYKKLEVELSSLSEYKLMQEEENARKKEAEEKFRREDYKKLEAELSSLSEYKLMQEEENARKKEAAEKYGSHGYVDLGLPSGLKWATCNVGAEKPEDYGNYFAWGETRIKREYTDSNSKTYGKKMKDISGNGEYDVARKQWGGTWRMPTEEEFEELKNECLWEWRNQNGIRGYKVTGTNGNSIFLPAAGYHDGSSLIHAGEYGNYWSSTPSSNEVFAYYLSFGSSYYGVYSNIRYKGQSVRPVSE